MNKPIIGISGSEIIDNSGIFPGYRRSYVNEDYIDSVIQNGGIPYIIPYNNNVEIIKEQVKNVQGLILSGGHDVSPDNYGEEPKQKIGDIWPERDNFDMLLLKTAEESNIPVLGICRGAQIINVAHGGNLYQDISYRKEETFKHSQDQTPTLLSHTVEVVANTKIEKILKISKLRTNSFHHQLIKNIAPDLIISARAMDGVIEAIESPDKNIIGIQWHPEMLHKKVEYQNNLFKYVINNAKKRK